MKEYIDGDVSVSFSSTDFQGYIDGNMFDDLKNLCLYVNSHRSMLNIDPSWNMSTDCIYNQLSRAALLQGKQYNYSQNQMVLLKWAYNDVPMAGTLLGINGDAKYIYGVPTFICANFSLMTKSSILQTNTKYTLKLMDHWKDAFTNHGCSNSSVNIIIGSEKFSFPILANEVLVSIELAIIISGLGFVVLLFVFTADIILTVVGVAIMTLTIVVSLNLAIYYGSGRVDLLDIVVLVAVIGMVVDFPIHTIINHRNERLVHESSRRLSSYGFMSYFQELGEVPISILFPLILITISGIPLLFATFILLSKFGLYTIIIGFVSFGCTSAILAPILPITIRTNIIHGVYDYMIKQRNRDDRVIICIE